MNMNWQRYLIKLFDNSLGGFRNWKPIHLCWWFRKHGWKVPKYLIGNPTYTSQYPPAHSDTYVKATTYNSASYYPHFATDPALSLTGTQVATSWLTTYGGNTNQRFHIDLGSAKVIKRIYYENFHHLGGALSRGVKNFTLWGSNTEASFLELTYATNTGWTQLTIAQSTFDFHVPVDQADPKYIVVTNTTAYRYYAFKCADNYTDSGRMGLRHIVLQTEDAITPTVTTQAVDNIEQTTATGHGTITNTGGENCHTRGICWNTSPNPTIANDKAEDNGAGSYGVGVFSKAMTGLVAGTHYYVRAYAINSAGISYGSQVEFDTEAAAGRSHGYIF